MLASPERVLEHGREGAGGGALADRGHVTYNQRRSRRQPATTIRVRHTSANSHQDGNQSEEGGSGFTVNG
jgi:hypothetical protein